MFLLQVDRGQLSAVSLGTCSLPYSWRTLASVF
jgi:hypothetical protein